MFGKYAGQKIKLAGEEHLIMKVDDVMAVIEGHTKQTVAATAGTATILKKKK